MIIIIIIIITIIITIIIRAVFKWLSKNQNQSYYSDQSQQMQTARWTNQNPQQLPQRNLLKARQKLRVQGAIGFGFTSNWLKKLAPDF